MGVKKSISSCSGRTSPVGCACRRGALPSGQLFTRYRQQVGREDRRPDITLERLPSLPGAPVQTEAALQPGDARLDAGPEAPKLLVDIRATAHLFGLQAPFLGKAHVLDPHGFGSLQAEPEESHDHGRPQHLLGAHAFGPGTAIAGLALAKILPHKIDGDRLAVQDGRGRVVIDFQIESSRIDPGNVRGRIGHRDLVPRGHPLLPQYLRRQDGGEGQLPHGRGNHHLAGAPDQGQDSM